MEKKGTFVVCNNQYMSKRYTNVCVGHVQYRMIEFLMRKQQLERVASVVEERNSGLADVTREVWDLRLQFGERYMTKQHYTNFDRV